MIYPDKFEQIKAILSGRHAEFALRYVNMEMSKKDGSEILSIPYEKAVNFTDDEKKRYFGKYSISIPYEKVFNVTRSEIKDYLKHHYSITDLVPPEPKDGLFAEKIDNGYILYYQDYGRICQSKFIENDDRLFDEYVKFTIDHSFTGYNFDKAPDNQDSGL